MKKIKSVMVLGSEGQIGKPLSLYLRKNNIKVYDVDLLSGKEHDLRGDCKLIDYWLNSVDFVFFLAYDIGGTKFLKTRQGDFEFLMNNTKIMANTFSLLEKHKKPFIFASSVMAGMPWSTYGDLKRLGEHFTESLGGITTRFWNVYGPEHDEEKSHVITDFVKKAKTTGVIDMMTDGTEERQFLYADDCAAALLSLAQKYDEAKKHKKFDVSNFVWTDIKTIANTIAGHYNAKVIPSINVDSVQKNSKIEPNKNPIQIFWQPEKCISIEDGIAKMVEHYNKI
jgi:nucleoside-diphosphate-sugar epimerase